MLQVDHVYEFFYSTIFKEFDLYHCFSGVVSTNKINRADVSVFTPGLHATKKIFFYDQEPLLIKLSDAYFDVFNFPEPLSLTEILAHIAADSLPFNISKPREVDVQFLINNPGCLYKQKITVTSEKSALAETYATKYNTHLLYYFFHGFAALDWYRGFYAMNYNKQVIKDYKYDFVSFNRIIISDRSYRCYFISLLTANLLLEHGQISFGIDTQENGMWQDAIADPNTKLSQKAIDHIKLHLPSTPLIIDNKHVQGSASADIPRCINNSLWHIVTETVFYYDKLHLTEKIFKPIAMKQPFMLLAAPGNLAYLKSYGFKTFEDIIDESYDTIQDNDLRTEAVVAQIAWYCALSAEEKRAVIEAIAPIVEYNFHHFYGEFKHIITRELLDNCKTLFKEIDYDDSAIAYDDVYRVLTN